jgi:hypothetical protein
MCPKKHLCRSTKVAKEGFKCQGKCKKKNFEEGDEMYECDRCQYKVCTDCK